jgi:N-carbamoylputrescine amidase
MKVTVCELNDDRVRFEEDWHKLVAHVQTNASELVVLNEMPFSTWFGVTPDFDMAIWQAVVAEHEAWLPRLKALEGATVISSRPVTQGTRRLNEGFIWYANLGYRATHLKYYLPDEAGVWEASWYQRGDGRFDLVSTPSSKIGFLICSELWAMSRAQAYGKAGAHLLVTPRATGQTSVEKWLTGGRAAAIVAGAFSLSSNRVSDSAFGGGGWIINPEGEVLALTSRDQPFVTVEIDLAEAVRAKTTYPRYVLD